MAQPRDLKFWHSIALHEVQVAASGGHGQAASISKLLRQQTYTQSKPWALSMGPDLEHLYFPILYHIPIRAHTVSLSKLRLKD